MVLLEEVVEVQQAVALKEVILYTGGNKVLAPDLPKRDEFQKVHLLYRRDGVIQAEVAPHYHVEGKILEVAHRLQDANNVHGVLFQREDAIEVAVVLQETGRHHEKITDDRDLARNRLITGKKQKKEKEKKCG